MVPYGSVKDIIDFKPRVDVSLWSETSGFCLSHTEFCAPAYHLVCFIALRNEINKVRRKGREASRWVFIYLFIF